MKQNAVVKVGLIACVMALVAALAAGCAGSGGTQASKEAQQNRAYMSQVNETMDQLSVQLESFVDAVSRGDVVNMRTQADNAYKTLDKLAAIEPPDVFTDIQKGYVDGTAKLRQALNDYIALYTDMESESFDQSTFDERMANVQAAYDEGVKLLQDTDKKAADLE